MKYTIVAEMLNQNAKVIGYVVITPSDSFTTLSIEEIAVLCRNGNTEVPKRSELIKVWWNGVPHEDSVNTMIVLNTLYSNKALIGYTVVKATSQSIGVFRYKVNDIKVLSKTYRVLNGRRMSDGKVVPKVGKFDMVYITTPEDKCSKYCIVKMGVLSVWKTNSMEVAVIPDFVHTIGCCVFKGHEEITKVVIPDSVKSIENKAFWGCKGLKSISIGKGVELIGDNIFKDCHSLERIDVDSSNKNFSSDNGVLFSKEKSILVAYPQGKKGAYIIPDGVTEICGGAFDNCYRLTDITIPDSVTFIGWDAFQNCKELTSVTIPDSVTEIGFGAFSNCTKLTSITIPNSVTQIDDFAFDGCKGLTSVVIPDSVTNIGGNVFYRCDALKRVKIPRKCIDCDINEFVKDIGLGNGNIAIEWY